MRLAQRSRQVSYLSRAELPQSRRVDVRPTAPRLEGREAPPAARRSFPTSKNWRFQFPTDCFGCQRRAYFDPL
jgi:hypothetical protein